MSVWERVLERPPDIRDETVVDHWMTQIAVQLLDGSRLVVADATHRIVEIEFYYYGDGHFDPFAHRDTLQLELGRWYFHRSGGSYRNGSFKGLDLTFGDGAAFGGILIRCLEAPDGKLIDGPSLCVDHLLRVVGTDSVANLANMVDSRAAWARECPLVLTTAPASHSQIFRTGRVGLSLKKASQSAEMTRYIMRPYRFLTEPRRVSKGKLYLVLALHAQGYDPDRITAITGCPRKSIERYIEDFKAGSTATDFTAFFGMDLGPKELCRLHGLWHRLMGAKHA